MHQLYNTKDNHIISVNQIMDKIHCYYSHSYDICYRSQIKPETEQKSIECNKHKQVHQKTNKFSQLSGDHANIATGSTGYSFGIPFAYNTYGSYLEYGLPWSMSSVKRKPIKQKQEVDFR